MKSKLNIKAIIIILFVSFILAFIYNYFSNDGIAFIRKPIIVKSVNILSHDDSSEELSGLSIDQVIGLYNQNAAIFIDARDQWDYAESHIKGAINIPEFSFSPNDQILATINKESLIIIYCDGDDCDTSKRLAVEITKLGYKNIFVFLGGFKEWSEVKLPVSKVETNE